MRYVDLPEKMLGRVLIADIRYALSRKTEASFDAHLELVEFVMERFSKRYQMYISEKLLEEIKRSFIFKCKPDLSIEWEKYKDYLKKYTFDKK